MNKPANSSVQWFFGTSTATGDTVTKFYTATGAYDVTMVVTFQDNSTCTLTKAGIVQVSKPIPKITTVPAIDTIQCTVPATVTFTENSPNIISYNWFIDGLPYSGKTVTHTFNTPGCKDIIITMINSDSCTNNIDTIRRVVCLYPPITGTITQTKSSVCVPTNIKFSPNLTLNGQTITGYSWSFQGAVPSTSTDSVPQNILYNTGGTYPFECKITTSNGCVTTLNDIVTVGARPPSTLSFTIDTLVCIRQRSVYRNTTIGADTLHGSFLFTNHGAGSIITNPNDPQEAWVTFANQGRYRVTLFYSDNGCIISKDSFITVIGTAASIYANPNDLAICVPPDTVRFTTTNAGPGATYRWVIVKNGTTQLVPPTPITTTNPYYTQTFTDTGAFDVKIIITDSYGCVDSLTRTNYVQVGKPRALMTTAPLGIPPDGRTVRICLGEPVNLISLTEPSNLYLRNWEITSPAGRVKFYGGGTYLFTPDTIGTYIIRHIISNGSFCPDTSAAYRLEVRGVLATISVDTLSGCPGLTTQLHSNIIANFPTSQLAYTWSVTPNVGTSFNNPSLANPTLTITNPIYQTYQVSLIVRNIASGCTTEVFLPQPITIGTLAFLQMPPNGCKNEPFLGTSSFQLNTPTGYQWLVTSANPVSIVNGTTDSATIVFGDTGVYVVQLVANLGNTCYDTISQTVTVYDVKIDSISANLRIAACASQVWKTITFRAYSKDPFAQYEWDFGDGSGSWFSSTDSIKHVYKRNGNFNIKVIMTGVNGCHDTLIVPDFIFIDGPVVDLEIVNSQGCGVVNTMIINRSDRYTRLFLDFGDGSPLDTINFNVLYHTYQFRYLPQNNRYIDTYQLKLVLNDGSCTAVDSNYLVQVYRVPDNTFSVTPISGCEPLQVTLKDSTQFIATRNWFFDADSIADDTSQIVNRVFTYGNHHIRLETISPQGCRDTSDTIITVFPKPESMFEVTDTGVCLSRPIGYLDLSYIKDSTPLGIRINWGDGTQETTTASGGHIYNTPGQYTITEILTSSHGCNDTSSQTVTVYDPIVADFASNPTYPNTSLSEFADYFFSNQSSVKPPATSYESLWDFGDSVTTTDQNPNHHYDTEGTYNVRLIVVDNNGCKDTVTHGQYRVIVKQIEIPDVFTPNGDGINDTWKVAYRDFRPIKITIVDRWGNTVFKSQNPTTQWRGTNLNNQDLPEGIYFYYITIEKEEFKGTITLLR
ncbi:MAG: PKD domain-containing protein [Bacteroidia bacterium]|nr:PKD domain-containing protein [Bacteroidia bacterium]